MFAGGEPAGAERRSGRFGGWKTFPEMCAKMKKESDFVETVSGDREVTFATDRTVIAVDWQTYDEVARLLEEAIGEGFAPDAHTELFAGVRTADAAKGLLAAAKAKAGECIPAHSLEALYLRRSSAEEKS